MKTKLRHLTLTHCIIVAFLSLLFAPAADAAWWREYQKMAMYISAETVEAIESPQERAAAQLFKKEFWLDGQFITPSQLNRINAENFDCIWIHIDSNGLGSSAANYIGYNSPEFISAIRKFHQDGGNLYLSKFAVQLLFSDGISRLDDKFRPNIFSDGEGKSEGNIWCINAEIGARALSPGWDTPTQYHDRRNHIIYSGLTTMKSTEWTIDKDPIYDRYVYDVFPMQGASDKSSTQRYDHNCMWRLSGKTTEGLKVGMYIGDNDKFNIDGIAYPQEKAAIKFTQTFNVDQEVEIITKDDLVRIDPNNFDCLWIHIDRPGLSQGWTNLPEAFRNEEFITKLRSYVKEGGNLYLTKYATQLTVPVERIPEKYAPNIFDTGSGNTGDTPWYIQAQINYLWKDSNPDIFHDRTHHDIYIGMTMQEYQPNNDFRYNAFPAIKGEVENHNCLWDLNRFYTGGNKVEQFREENLVRILGTWGHVVDDAVAGIIEFRPTPQIQGRIIANGLAAYQFSESNPYSDNIGTLTKNCIKYLSKSSDYDFTSPGEDNVARFEGDTNSKILGTWGQDWDHQAAGIVEFEPLAEHLLSYRPKVLLDNEINKTKAHPGTVIANGIGCMQLHANGTRNDYLDNTEKLTRNIIDYLSPWYGEMTGIEDVADADNVKVTSHPGGLAYANVPAGSEICVYTSDGRRADTFTADGHGTRAIAFRGIAVVTVNGTPFKVIIP